MQSSSRKSLCRTCSYPAPAPARALVAHQYFVRAGIGVFILFVSFIPASSCKAQSSIPFQVSNPKHKKWPEPEAVKIYFSACEQAARAIRPENPPHLRPKIVLVLGAGNDETFRYADKSEIRLKSWRPERFAEAVVVLAVREVLAREQVAEVVRTVMLSSEASVSADELKQGR
jgi:hypothetical protein